MGDGARVAARQGRGHRRRRRRSTRRATSGSRSRRLRARAADRRAHRLGAERRLARRLPERHGRRGGAAPHRRGGQPPRHRAARQLGRRGGRAVRPLALRVVRGGRLDGRPGRAARSGRRATASRCPTRLARTASISTARSTRARSWRTRPPTSSCTSSRARCWSRWTSRSASCSARSASSAHLITFRGQAAHAGSTPMDKRRDALAGAAKLELEIREIAKRTGGGAVCTMGGVVTKPGIVTSVVETAECLLDQRHLDAATLARDARRGEGARRAVRGGGGHRGRVGADLEHRADPVRRRADRARRRGDPRGRGRRRTACRAARCTTPPRSRAPACRR